VEPLPIGPQPVRKRLLERLRAFLAEGEAGLVFVTYRKEARDVAQFLLSEDVPAAALHGEMSQSERTAVLQRFRRGTLRVLVATDVAARGLDVQTLRYVINCSPGMSVEQYVHRVGRCGRRPGDVGTAHTFVTDADSRLLPELVPLLQRWGQIVPPVVLQMAQRAEQKAERRGASEDAGEENEDDEEETRRANRERQKRGHTQQQAKARRQQKPHQWGKR